MEKMKVTWFVALKVWWSFAWRATLFSILIGVVVGFVMGVALVLQGYSVESIERIGNVTGYLLSIPVSIWVIKIVLEKKFNGYSLAVVREVDTSDGDG